MSTSTVAPSEAVVPESDVAVAVEGITKRFPGVVANHDVTFAVRRGTVHALVGENGAGKSTLMKILYGIQQPDEGTITVDGRRITPKNPADAIAAGVGMVFQHFMLADNLTVTENVVLGAEKLHGIGGAARAEIVRISDQYGLGVDPDALVADLGVGARQRVEILKVLYRGVKVLILDEPTAVLVPQEVDALFANLAELKREGLTVIFISHKLDEVLSVADAITVIRRGTTVTTIDDPSTIGSRQLAELMVGSELPTPQTEESTVTDREVLRIDGVSLAGGAEVGRDLLSDISVTIHAGEVVGIAGVEGNGQQELVEIAMGMREPTAGRVLLGETDVSDWGVREIREAGVGYIPADRHRQGMLLDAPLWENRMLGHQTQEPNGAHGMLRNRAARKDTERIVREYDVRTPGVDVTAGSLSGGNQQKLIIGREMSHDPVVLVASHPTRGVDVGAQAAIWDHLRAARREGLGVLLVSADLEELIGLSDTIHVILRGAITATFDPDVVTSEDLGAAMTGAGTAAATDPTTTEAAR